MIWDQSTSTQQTFNQTINVVELWHNQCKTLTTAGLPNTAMRTVLSLLIQMTVKSLLASIALATESLKPRRAKIRRKTLLLKQNTKRRNKLIRIECSRRDSSSSNQLARKIKGQKKLSDWTRSLSTNRRVVWTIGQSRWCARMSTYTKLKKSSQAMFTLNQWSLSWMASRLSCLTPAVKWHKATLKSNRTLLPF